MLEQRDLHRHAGYEAIPLGIVHADPQRGGSAGQQLALTYDPQIWQDSIAGTPTAHPGQLPPYKSLYAEWDATPPDWMPPFVGLVRGQLDRARAINNHLFGLQQFVIGQPVWETYLKGEESDPRVALQNVTDAVQAEMKRG